MAIFKKVESIYKPIVLFINYGFYVILATQPLLRYYQNYQNKIKILLKITEIDYWLIIIYYFYEMALLKCINISE